MDFVTGEESASGEIEDTALITSEVRAHRIKLAGHEARAHPTRRIRQALDGRRTSPRVRPRL